MVFVPERCAGHDSDTGNGAGYSTGDGADRDIAEGTGSAYGAIGSCRGSVLCPNADALGGLHSPFYGTAGHGGDVTIHFARTLIAAGGSRGGQIGLAFWGTPVAEGCATACNCRS